MIAKLGTPNDQLRFAIDSKALAEFGDESPLVQRIVREKLPGWEYRLTAALLRDYLSGSLRKWRDLKSELYSRPSVVLTRENTIDWLQSKMTEAGRIIPIIAKLYSEELKRGWGAPGQAGNPVEIRHACSLIHSAVEQLLLWEESVRFVSAPKSHGKLIALLAETLGRHLNKIEGIPASLDECVDWLETNPSVQKTFGYELIFDMPDNWTEKLTLELKTLY